VLPEIVLGERPVPDYQYRPGYLHGAPGPRTTAIVLAGRADQMVARRHSSNTSPFFCWPNYYEEITLEQHAGGVCEHVGCGSYFGAGS